MASEDVRVSVAMTTFQAQRHLEEQLSSILAQTRLPDEVVVSDDASSDSTIVMLEQFALTAPMPVRVLRQRHNVGLRRNVEAALSACRGSVLVLADQDDVWARTKLEIVAHAFRDRTVALWFSDADLVDEGGRSLHATAWQAAHFGADDQRRVAAGEGLRRLLHGMTVTGATMAMRADLMEIALPLPVELDGPSHLFLHDGWLAVLASLLGECVVEPSPLTNYRQHHRQVTGMSMARTAGAAEMHQPAEPPASHESRRDQLQVDHARVKLVADRLREADAIAGCRPRAVAELQDLEEFLDVRILERNERGRRARVLRQLARGAYSRHARGLRTALADLA